ncbi:MAG: hypothetical protein ABR586_01265 [Thermoplasmatota archaeon]
MATREGFPSSAAGLPDSVTRHHLKKLERLGLVVAQQHGRTVRYFENHGRYDKTWREVVAMQEPAMRQLLNWLRQHSGCSQQDLVAQARQLGLTRRATQRRLQHLQAWGLVSTHLEGRTKCYRLAR